MMKLIKKIVRFIKGLFKKPEKEKKIELPLATCGVRIANEKEFLTNEKAMKSFRAKSGNKTYVIPLVFHVLHKGEAYGTGTNISDEQIYSCVNALNEDYSKEPNSRGDGNGAITPFRFMLANKDDKGNPTTGIYRINGAELSDAYAQDGARANSKGCAESVFKNWSRLNNQRVCNIWVVSEIEGNNGGSGIQGYAYFPTTNYVDGIVALYNAVGKRHPNVPYGTVPNINVKSYTSLNRTLTHELGHYFGLFHTFQGNSCEETDCNWQGDRVCDTPPTIKNSNGNYPACGGTQQVENYMDYTGQTFKNMFTQGQTDRMLAACEASRPNLITSNALENLNTLPVQASMSITSPNNIICPNTDKYLSVGVTNLSSNVIHKINFEYQVGEDIHTHTWYGPIAPQGVYGYDNITLAKLDIDSTTNVTVNIIAINDIPYSLSSTKEIIIPTNAPYKIEILQDAIAGQINWDIVDANTLEPIYVSPKYVNFKPGILLEHNICLPDGEYILTLVDIVPGMQTEGAYIKFIDNKGDVLINTLEFQQPLSNIQFPFVVSSNKSADINNDGIVNLLDLSKLSSHFGTTKGEENFNEAADINNDGFINILDASIIIEALNKNKNKK